MILFGVNNYCIIMKIATQCKVGMRKPSFIVCCMQGHTMHVMQRHTMHVMQKANRQMSMAANAPPPAAPMMMYRSNLTLLGAVASLAIILEKKGRIQHKIKDNYNYYYTNSCNVEQLTQLYS